MFIEADRNFDYQLGGEILSLYKESRQAMVDKQRSEAEEKRKRDLNAAKTGSSSTGETPKKIYRRADLIKLRIYDPDKFNAMQDEILQAYKEGRVR